VDNKWPVYTRILQLIQEKQRAGSSSVCVLDAGCGRGGLLDSIRQAPGVSAVGFDGSAVAVQKCKARLLTVGAARLEAFDLVGDGFDVVVASDLLDCLDDPAAGVGRLVSLARSGGLVVVSLPIGQEVDYPQTCRPTGPEVGAWLADAGAPKIQVEDVVYRDRVLRSLFVARRI